ncbi:Rv2175c family DNA-binding protein [Microbacterium karelineae]|uniref:Rv2175c family DNA-binding protein n=1 Tax=Microbacterium karelineae TaxID=2654283 RepID=UPI0012EA86E4|nr:Rv2175c family DNA-binding protein [Microbacterium karelineae]
MTDDAASAADAIEWLTLPDVAERLGEAPGRVRRLIDDRALVAVRRDGIRVVPADFIDGDRPLSSLRGTVIVLQDVGLDDEEIIAWLYAEEPSLGNAPIASLLAGRKAEVRRVAVTLA